MVNTVKYPSNPSVGQEFTIGNITKIWDGEKWVNGSYGNHEARISYNLNLIKGILRSFRKNYIGSISNTGVTFTADDQVAADEFGNFWECISPTLPYVVEKGTSPVQDTNLTELFLIDLQV